jgi:hypothetical protein
MPRINLSLLKPLHLKQLPNFSVLKNANPITQEIALLVVKNRVKVVQGRVKIGLDRTVLSPTP